MVYVERDKIQKEYILLQLDDFELLSPTEARSLADDLDQLADEIEADR
jgi:hypothetical protein